MKTRDIIWFIIIGLGIYGVFADIQWLANTVAPVLIGIFILTTGKQQVDDGNSFYEKMSKRIPFLFPPSWVEKSPSKAQILITVIVGILFIVFGFVSFFIM